MSKITADLVKIPTKYIISDQEFNVDLIKVLGLSKVYSSNTDDLNIIPITVVPKEDGYYSLVTGYEIYQALKEELYYLSHKFYNYRHSLLEVLF